MWRKYIEELDLTYKKRYYILINQIFRFCNDFFDYDCKVVKMLPPFKTSAPDITLLDKEKYVSYEDFKKFIKACETRKLRVLFILTYFTGLRLGEVLGLQKQCYDASTKTLYIYQSLTNKTGTRKSVLLSPKSKESIRKYYLPEFLPSFCFHVLMFLSLAFFDLVCLFFNSFFCICRAIRTTNSNQ